MYEGNFKSMKRKRVEKDPPTGSEVKVVKKSAFLGCGPAVKALYAGFKDLPYRHKDGLFMSRLMVISMNVYKLDKEREMGKKAILFSSYKPIFYKLQFRKGENCGSLIGIFRSRQRFFFMLLASRTTFTQNYVPTRLICPCMGQ